MHSGLAYLNRLGRIALGAAATQTALRPDARGGGRIWPCAVLFLSTRRLGSMHERVHTGGARRNMVWAHSGTLGCG